MTRTLAGGLLLSLLLAQTAVAEDPVGSLELDTVLASSATHFPGILRTLAARRAVEGRNLEVEGAFDLVFAADGFSRLSGFYDGTAVEGTVRQRLRPLGASVYAGYKLSDGTFPIYEDIAFTNTGGALKVGVLFSLMRDRDIDRERFDERDARLELREADLDVLLTRIGVQQRALVAYWRWVALGRKLRVYENLLRIALERQDGLEEQVRQGALANIFLTENLQNITRRQSLVTAAERDLAVAANDLSLFYRDGAGLPLVPTEAELPPGVPLSEIDNLAVADEFAVTEALSRRPELALLRTAIERERNRLLLRRNDLRPRLDFNVEAQSGLGSIAEGGPSRDSDDTIVGFTFSVPFQQRAERGRLRQSLAELDAKQEEQRLAEEQIQLEVRNVLLNLRVSRELLLLAAQEVQQSEIMRAAELRRFQSGASDFFLVNVREETAADARIKLLEAELNTRLARANYDAATVNLPRLGLN